MMVSKREMERESTMIPLTQIGMLSEKILVQ
jgi:hypothetical protein